VGRPRLTRNANARKDKHMTAEPVRVGVVGCGAISGVYFQNMKTFDVLDVAACADLDMTRAEAAAKEHGVPRACTTEELLADPEIEVVLNLTVPAAHAAVGRAAVEAGKSVYNEKPLTIARDEGRMLLEAARKKKVLVGCAPDTFLGGGHQTCRKLIDEGQIGEPVAATAFMMSPGVESWHPNPEFYYKVGGGPMFDMGPYYLTDLVMLLGPIRRVSGATCKGRAERVATCEAKKGLRITVDVPTHVAGVMDFENGAVGTIIMSFDVWGAHLPSIEIYGTEGSLSVPDPNGFGGTVRLCRAGEDGWTDVPLTHGYAGNGRGVGLADLAVALRTGRPHRASGGLAYHVLDAMHAFHDASDLGKHVVLTSGVDRPAALPVGLADGDLDE